MKLIGMVIHTPDQANGEDWFWELYDPADHCRWITPKIGSKHRYLAFESLSKIAETLKANPAREVGASLIQIPVDQSQNRIREDELKAWCLDPIVEFNGNLMPIHQGIEEAKIQG